MPADIFGEAVDRQVGALRERLGPQRPEEGVVDRDRRTLARGEGGIARGRDRLDVDQRIGRVRRAFEIDERQPALALRVGDDGVDLLARRTRRKVDVMNAEPAENLGDQRLRRRVERPRVDDHVARLNEGQQQGRDGRHSAGESERVVRVLPDRKPVLEDLLVGAVEARIDEPLGAARALAGHAFEEALSGRRILEHEGRGEKDRRLQRAFAELGIEAVAEHQASGL